MKTHVWAAAGQGEGAQVQGAASGPLGLDAPVDEPGPDLLGEMIHDLRGLITVIKGYAELIQKQDQSSGTAQQAFCGKILRSCGQMSELVESCLGLAALESGQPPLEPQLVNLRALIEESVATLSESSTRKSIRFVFDLPADLPMVRASRASVARALYNLLSNALKFSPCGSVVSIVAQPVRNELHVAVRDQGPGIPASEIEELFLPYRRGSAQPTGGETSTGLGLAIVRRLIESCGGRVMVKSELGSGSVFTLALPASDAEPPQADQQLDAVAHRGHGV